MLKTIQFPVLNVFQSAKNKFENTLKAFCDFLSHHITHNINISLNHFRLRLKRANVYASKGNGKSESRHKTTFCRLLDSNLCQQFGIERKYEE